MHLWLYSSGGILNEDIDIAMMRFFHEDNPKLTFVPSSFDTSHYYFDEFVDRFERFGFQNFTLFHLDQHHSSKDLDRLMKSDMIYLSGGNTFYFLAVCRKTGFFDFLRNFVKKGGILAGHSAGAILQTPTITTASYPEDDRDENEVGIRDLTASGLVGFEFFPHYDHGPYYQEVLRGASLETPHVIYGVSDGGAICINGTSTSFFGEIWAFYQGESFQINKP